MDNLFEAANAPTTEPLEFVVGDFVQWKRSDLNEAYSNSTHTATYISKDASGGSHEFQVTGSASGTDYLFTISSSTSSAFTAGHHYWHLEIVRNSDSARIVLERGQWEVRSDIDVAGVDPRTFEKKMVDKIESLLLGRADTDVGSYSIAGRSLTKMTFAELEEARDKFQGIVKRQEAEARVKRGKASSNTVKVRFS